MDLSRNVLRLIKAEGLITAGDRVLVAVSGGMDSVVLLHLLKELTEAMPHELAVAHVNHQLRGEESDRDERFVRKLAHKLSLPFHLTRVDVRQHSRKEGISLQHAGRDLRYAYFHEVARAGNYGKIAIAHNLDDQVETFLLRIIKGTGIRGLGSIPVKREAIIRPLLFTPRSEIATYVRGRGLRYVRDSSNRKETYERNFVRRRLVPRMEDLNPAFREKILFLLQDMTRLNRLFDEQAHTFMNDLSETTGAISVPVLKILDLDEEVRFRVLSAILFSLEPTFIPLRNHIGLIEKALRSPKPNITVALPRGIRMEKAYGTLLLTREAPPLSVSGSFPVAPGFTSLPAFNITLEVSETDERPVCLATDSSNAIFDRELLQDLHVRAFRNGDRFIPLGMKELVKLKDFFISRKIPRHERRRIPLLLSGKDIIWVVGQRIDERYKVTGDSCHFLKVRAEGQGLSTLHNFPLTTTL